MESSDKGDRDAAGQRRRPFWHRPWYLMFAGLILLAALLGIAFGGKALGLWKEVGFAVGAVSLAIIWILYTISNVIQRREIGED